ncbi:MAG: hypothetical protein JW728_05155 [Candidatus Aureabacteria bacterium]|nr:hypothetical protein [Candidatus Auribacterota bacterium]
MRKTIQVLAVVAAISAGSFAFAQARPQAKVIAYYFHGSYRCPTCNNMEKYSREAIETNFKDALSSGKLEFSPVNVEERGNEHFAEDYKLYTKALILSSVMDGREIRYKNLDKIWQLARNKQKFIDYVTDEVNEFMKEER